MNQSQVGNSNGPRRTYVVTESLLKRRNHFFHARNEADGEKVFIKRYLEDPGFQRERFVQELLAQKQQHPNLLYPLEFHDSTKIGVFPFISGGTLEALLKRLGPMSIEQLKPVVEGTAKGLEHLHYNGVVHRDIKPSNILLQSTNPEIEEINYRILEKGNITAQIFDFDMSRHPDIAELDEDERGMTLIYGTPRYMSPEAWDTPAVDRRSDLYALAVTIYHAISGEYPFNGGNAGEIMFAHQEKPISKITEYNASLPQDFNGFFQKALAKNPGERFQTPEELARAYVEITG